MGKDFRGAGGGPSQSLALQISGQRSWEFHPGRGHRRVQGAEWTVISWSGLGLPSAHDSRRVTGSNPSSRHSDPGQLPPPVTDNRAGANTGKCRTPRHHTTNPPGTSLLPTHPTHPPTLTHTTDTHAHSQSHTYAHTHTQSHTRTHKHSHAHTLTHLYTHSHTHTHTLAHTCTHAARGAYTFHLVRPLSGPDIRPVPHRTGHWFASRARSDTSQTSLGSPRAPGRRQSLFGMRRGGAAQRRLRAALTSAPRARAGEDGAGESRRGWRGSRPAPTPDPPDPPHLLRASPLQAVCGASSEDAQATWEQQPGCSAVLPASEQTGVPCPPPPGTISRRGSGTGRGVRLRWALGGRTPTRGDPSALRGPRSWVRTCMDRPPAPRPCPGGRPPRPPRGPVPEAPPRRPPPAPHLLAAWPPGPL